MTPPVNKRQEWFLWAEVVAVAFIILGVSLFVIGGKVGYLVMLVAFYLVGYLMRARRERARRRAR